jgi:hypothetical protein
MCAAAQSQFLFWIWESDVNQRFARAVAAKRSASCGCAAFGRRAQPRNFIFYRENY